MTTNTLTPQANESREETGFTYASLREANVARQAVWCPDEVPDLMFRSNELAGETGEACNVVKKLERERKGWRGSRDTLEHLAEELADVVITADLAAITAGIDLEKAVADKFNATSAKHGFLHRIAPGSGILAEQTPTPPPIQQSSQSLPLPSVEDDGEGKEAAFAPCPTGDHCWIRQSDQKHLSPEDVIASLLRENQELREDKKRLDWLETQFRRDGAGPMYWLGRQYRRGPFREAIDSALSVSGEKNEEAQKANGLASGLNPDAVEGATLQGAGEELFSALAKARHAMEWYDWQHSTDTDCREYRAWKTVNDALTSSPTTKPAEAASPPLGESPSLLPRQSFTRGEGGEVVYE